MHKILKVSVAAGILGVCLIGGVIVFQPKSTPVEGKQSTSIEMIMQIAEGIEITPIEYELTDYDKLCIKFHLLELRCGNMTEDDLTELYAKYGEKVDEIKEAMEKEYEEKTDMPVENTLVQIHYSFDDFMSYSCNEKLNSSLQSYVEKVPKGVLDLVQSIGYHIELVEDPAKELGQNKKWCGVTLLEQKRILIQAKEYKFRKSVVHEIFHAYDSYFGFVSESAEFHEIFEAEKDSFIVTGCISDTYHKTNVKEYFAEACQQYVYDAGSLQSSAPRTYAFVKSYIEGVPNNE